MHGTEVPDTPEYVEFRCYWRGVRNQIIAACVGILAFYLAIDVVFFPWDYRWPGHPPLTDDWHGEIVVNGRPTSIVLRLDSKSSGKRDMGKTLLVDARLCDAAGARDFHGTSKPRGWSGSRFSTSTMARDERPEGIRALALQAQWDGADALEVRAGLAEQPMTVSTHEGASIPEPLVLSTTMRRGAAPVGGYPCRIG